MSTPRARRLADRKAAADAFVARPLPVLNMMTEVIHDMQEEVHLLKRGEQMSAFAVELSSRMSRAVAMEDPAFLGYREVPHLAVALAALRIFEAEIKKNGRSRRAPVDVLQARLKKRSIRQPVGWQIRVNRCIKWLTRMNLHY